MTQQDHPAPGDPGQTGGVEPPALPPSPSEQPPPEQPAPPAGWQPGQYMLPPPPVAVPGPFAAAPRPVRERWINPRRRWATWLVAAGIAVVFFGGGIGAGLGIAGGHDVGTHARFEQPFRMMIPGQGDGFGSMRRGGDGVQPAWPGRQGPGVGPYAPRNGGSGGSGATPSPSAGSSPSTAPTG